MSEQNELKPSNLATWPERIYLQHGDGDVPIYDECTEVTWCWHAIENNDVAYVRADLAPIVADERKTDEQIRDAALEEAAKVCEAQITGGDYHYLATHGHWDHMAQSAINCATAIRALMGKEGKS